MNTKRAIAPWKIVAIVAVLLFLVVRVLLFIAPPSPKAYEDWDTMDFHQIAFIVRQHMQQLGVRPKGFRELEEFAQKAHIKLSSARGGDLLLGDRVRRRDSAIGTDLGKIIVVGNKVDSLGMVWVVTDHGLAMKIAPRQMYKYGHEESGEGGYPPLGR
jgi:hypothetical protein